MGLCPVPKPHRWSSDPLKLWRLPVSKTGILFLRLNPTALIHKAVFPVLPYEENVWRNWLYLVTLSINTACEDASRQSKPTTASILRLRWYYTIPRVMLIYLEVTVVLCKRLVKVCYKLPLYKRLAKVCYKFDPIIYRLRRRLFLWIFFEVLTFTMLKRMEI